MDRGKYKVKLTIMEHIFHIYIYIYIYGEIYLGIKIIVWHYINGKKIIIIIIIIIMVEWLFFSLYVINLRSICTMVFTCPVLNVCYHWSNLSGYSDTNSFKNRRGIHEHNTKKYNTYFLRFMTKKSVWQTAKIPPKEHNKITMTFWSHTGYETI